LLKNGRYLNGVYRFLKIGYVKDAGWVFVVCEVLHLN